VVAGYCELRLFTLAGSSLFLLRAGFLRQQPLRVNRSLSGPQGRQDGINLAERRRNASNAILGASAAACHAARNEGHDGSPELDFRGYHTRRQQWSGFFCLPTGAGFRGVRGIMSPRLWVLGELVSIRSVFPRPTLRDIVSKHAAEQGSGAVCLWVPDRFAVFTRPNKPHSCSDTVRRRKHFTRVPLGIQAFDTPESAVNPELRVRPSTVTAGVRGDCAMGPLRCRRWCMRGSLRSECVSKDSARQSTTCRRGTIHRGRGLCRHRMVGPPAGRHGARGSGTALPLRVTGFFRGLVGWLVFCQCWRVLPSKTHGPQ